MDMGWREDDMEETEYEEEESEEAVERRTASDYTPSPKAMARDILRKPRWILVIDSLRDGPKRTVDIAEETGLPWSTVAKILRLFRRRGLLTISSGIYRGSPYYELSREGEATVSEMAESIKKMLRKCIGEDRTGSIECAEKTLGQGDYDVLAAMLSIAGAKVLKSGEKFKLEY